MTIPEKLISELLDLPERVRKGNFVLSLAKGVTEPEKTLERYVVTPQLADCFDDALGFIRSAVASASSTARFLHGSFGAGKSHFNVDLDTGLAVLSAHARSLGQDALILFLDELILWLLTHAGDLGFVYREANKLVKVVKSRKAERPIPIISFVARQRDLREIVGENVPGADRLNFSQMLSHFEGRFHTVTLDDRNLPVIARKRVLRPRNDACRMELEDSTWKWTWGGRRPAPRSPSGSRASPTTTGLSRACCCRSWSTASRRSRT